jgi:septal ring factor EnvC (AmiA/AmiB activator)
VGELKYFANTQNVFSLLFYTCHSFSHCIFWQDLEARVKALEDGAQFNANQAAIREREAEFLAQLKEIKETMAKEQASGGASSDEVKALKEENALLKAKLAKNEYRVRHLIEGMEEPLAAKAKA